jgi:transposase
VREARVASAPEALIAWFAGLGFGLARVGLEAGPLSQWLYAGLRAAGRPVDLLETRHVRQAEGASGSEDGAAVRARRCDRSLKLNEAGRRVDPARSLTLWAPAAA